MLRLLPPSLQVIAGMTLFTEEKGPGSPGGTRPIGLLLSESLNIDAVFAQGTPRELRLSGCGPEALQTQPHPTPQKPQCAQAARRAPAALFSPKAPSSSPRWLLGGGKEECSWGGVGGAGTDGPVAASTVRKTGTVGESLAWPGGRESRE